MSSIAISQLLDGQTRVPYETGLTATGGMSPYAWSLVSGSLPRWLSLAAMGQMTGTPTVSGVWSFTVQVNDAAGGTASQAFTLTIAGSGGAANILAAGFETPADRACPPTLSDGTCVNPGTWASASCPNPITYINNASGAHSGSWYADGLLAPSPARQYTCGWSYTVPAAHAGDTQIYVKEWLKYPVNWRWRCCGGGNEQKAFILENSASGVRPIVSLQAAVGLPGCSTGGDACDHANISLIGNATGYVYENQPGPGYCCIAADGQWHSLELFVDTVAGHWILWFDGAVYIDATLPGFAGPVNWTTAKYGNYFDMDCAGTDCNYYVDDIGLSTTFISVP